MLDFYSASTRIVNSKRAVAECLESALEGQNSTDCNLLVLHASMGHNYEDLLSEARSLAPSAVVVGSSCCGIVGKEGVSESMKDLAVLAVKGKEEDFVIASVDGIYGHNSFDLCAQMAQEMKDKNPNINMVYLLASGIDIATDQLIKGIESVLGEEVTIFGATSSDNMKGVSSFQLFNDKVMEHGAFLIGFSDPTLEVITQATHGFMAVGEPMEVTRSEANKIYELNGKPAWTEFTDRLGLPITATPGESIPIGALAEQLPDDVAQEYGNHHILRVVTKREEDGTMYYATNCPQGTKLWLTKRDEERIFTAMDEMMNQISEKLNGRKPVAVMHADCLARGKFLFNRVLKDELVSRMQYPLCQGQPIPWLGMYGFGEFARLGGNNEFHNYTTSLYVIVKR